MWFIHCSQKVASQIYRVVKEVYGKLNILCLILVLLRNNMRMFSPIFIKVDAAGDSAKTNVEEFLDSTKLS